MRRMAMTQGNSCCIGDVANDGEGNGLMLAARCSPLAAGGDAALCSAIANVALAMSVYGSRPRRGSHLAAKRQFAVGTNKCARGMWVELALRVQ